MHLTSTSNKNLSFIEEEKSPPQKDNGRAPTRGSALSVQQKNIATKSKGYNCLIIGLGQIASRYAEDARRKGIVTHAQAYLANPACKTLVGLDPNPKQRKRFTQKWGCPTHPNLHELLKSHQPDIISICTPPHQRAELIQTCLAYKPKAFFCEKPLAETVKEGLKIKKMVGQTPFLVNFSRRWDRMHQHITSDIQKGRWGKLISMDAYYSGTFRSNGSHLVDLIELISGQSIQQATSLAPFETNPDKALQGQLLLEDGSEVTIHHSPSYLLFELDIYLTKARIRLTNLGFKTSFWRAGKSDSFSGFQDLKEEPSPYTNGYQNVLANALKNLIDNIQKKSPLLASLEEGLKTLRVQEALIASAKKKGKPVTL